MFDQNLLLSLFDLSYKLAFLDTLIIIFAAGWEHIVVASIIVYLLFGRRDHQERAERLRSLVWAIVSALVARFGIVSTIRLLYPRPRPFVSEQFIPLVDHAANAGFPSGHATFFMALAVYFLLQKGRDRKYGWFLFVSAILIGVARVAAGIHWPSDVIVGWVVGAVVAVIGFYLASRKNKSTEIST